MKNKGINSNLKLIVQVREVVVEEEATEVEDWFNLLEGRLISLNLESKEEGEDSNPLLKIKK